MSAEDKTEKATPRKLKESRKEGKVARSQEVGAWAAVLAVSLSIQRLTGLGMDRIRTLFLRMLEMIVDPSVSDMLALLKQGGTLTVVMSLVLGSGIMVIGVLSAVAQGGLFFATKSLKPQWSRLNPLSGAKRVFGPHALWEGAKMVLKSALVGVFVWRAVVGLLPMVGGLVPLDVALGLAGDAAIGMMRDVALAGLVAATGDYAVQRRRIGKQVRMSKHEVKQENKQSEGDPHVKGQIRSRQLAAARNRMMADVPQADVVLVNPTHVAVALRYDPTKGTPRVVAKGKGVVATRIRELAVEHRISMVEDVPLARALHGACEVGQEIPPQLYQAVAQVLAFVLSLRNAGHPAGRHQSPRAGTALPDLPKGRHRAQGRPAVRPAKRSGPVPAGR